MCVSNVNVFFSTFPTYSMHVFSLMKEAQPLEDKRTVEMGEERARHAHYEEDEEEEGEGEDERKLLSRYGIWLLVERCKPKSDIPIVSTTITFLFFMTILEMNTSLPKSIAI